MKIKWALHVPSEAVDTFCAIRDLHVLTDKQLCDLADNIDEKYRPKKPNLTKVDAQKLIKLLEHVMPVYQTTIKEEYSYSDEVSDDDIFDTQLAEFISWLRKAK